MSDEQHQCDKGPVLNQMADNIAELKEGQTRMIDALIDIGAQNERITSVADKVAVNQKDISTLFGLFREHEQTANAHIIGAAAARITGHDNGMLQKAKNWTKLQVIVMTAAVMGLLNFVYDFITGVLDKLDKLG